MDSRSRIVVPLVVAIFATLIGFRLVGGPEAVGLPSGAIEVSSSPTPYSADHARVHTRGGEADEQPATF